MVKTAQGRKKVFEFEKVYTPHTSQEEVGTPLREEGTSLFFFSLPVIHPPLSLQIFQDTKPTILSCVDGYNVCIIAYGQTGAGKTFTMTGPQDNPGVNIRCASGRV